MSQKVTIRVTGIKNLDEAIEKLVEARSIVQKTITDLKWPMDAGIKIECDVDLQEETASGN